MAICAQFVWAIWKSCAASTWPCGTAIGARIPFEIADLDVRQEADRFTVAFDCRHRRGDIDFAWRATIRGEADGSLRFAMDGQARSTFLRNRIGICVLHPGAACGAPFTAELADGSLLAGTLPRAIAPTTPVPPYRSLTHEVCPGLRAHLEFSGDLFEMEDQRNWTDASFKTYSTPLALPFPVEVRAGSVVRQAVTLTLRGAIPAPVPPAPLTLTVTDAVAGPLPRLGLGIASHGQRLSPTEVRRLRALALAHVRVNLAPSQPGWRITLQRAIAESRALGVALEMAIHLSAAVEEELTALGAALQDARPPVASWLIFANGDAPIDAPVLAAARRLLGAYDASVPLGAGTNGNFVQLNRNRPPVELLDLVCYSINPQVHAFDNRSIMETPEGQGQTVVSARLFCGGRPLAITPVTLKPRFNPDATAAEPASAPTELPSQVDARQAALFGAAWTVASLKRLAEAGAASVTYYETPVGAASWKSSRARRSPNASRRLPGPSTRSTTCSPTPATGREPTFGGPSRTTHRASTVWPWNGTDASASCSPTSPTKRRKSSWMASGAAPRSAARQRVARPRPAQSGRLSSAA